MWTLSRGLSAWTTNRAGLWLWDQAHFSRNRTQCCWHGSERHSRVARSCRLVYSSWIWSPKHKSSRNCAQKERGLVQSSLHVEAKLGAPVSISLVRTLLLRRNTPCARIELGLFINRQAVSPAVVVTDKTRCEKFSNKSKPRIKGSISYVIVPGTSHPWATTSHQNVESYWNIRKQVTDYSTTNSPGPSKNKTKCPSQFWSFSRRNIDTFVSQKIVKLGVADLASWARALRLPWFERLGRSWAWCVEWTGTQSRSCACRSWRDVCSSCRWAERKMEFQRRTGLCCPDGWEWPKVFPLVWPPMTFDIWQPSSSNRKADWNKRFLFVKQYGELVFGNCQELPTLSMLVSFRRMIDVWASRSNIILRPFFEHISCGRNISSWKRSLNMLETMSCITVWMNRRTDRSNFPRQNQL